METVPKIDTELLVKRNNSELRRQLFEKAQKYLHAMQIPEACKSFQSAEEAGFDPDACAAGRWTCYMLLGDFDAAWSESDAISRRGNPDSHRFWDGQPLEGKNVLLRCLHGLGDTLQYIRYAPLIRQKAASLTVEAQPLLKSLLHQAEIADRVITWGETEPCWDQQIEVVELPRIFRTTIDSIPQQVPYIRVPGSAERRKFAQNSTYLRIGLIWASSTFNPARSIRLNELEEVLELPGTAFFSFQAGEERAQLEPWANRISDCYKEEQSVLETAIGLNTMDLVITVDTMTAHLAGAMGLEVWTLLPYLSDWRWMLHRDDSPWYPTMRLFRQRRPGDWQGAVRQLMDALKQKLNQ